MRKITIELPDTVTVARGGGSVELPTKTLDADMVVRLFVHGVVQKVGDAASNASKVAAETKTPVADVANGQMLVVVNNLTANVWGATRGGDGVDERTRVARSVVFGELKRKFGAKSPEWAEFTGRPEAAQAARLDEIFAEHEATFAPEVEKELERRRAKAATKGTLAKSIEVKL